MGSRHTTPFEPDLSPEEFTQLGYRTVDMLAEYYASLDERRVYPSADPEAIAEAFDEPLPETGQDPDEILDEWASKVLANATHNTSPRYFGYVMGSGSMMGTLAEALAAGTNMNVGGWHPAPSGTEVERQCIRWLATAIDYPEDTGGLLTSGGTMANVTALFSAFHASTGYDSVSQGLQTDEAEGTYTIYMSDHEGHSSIYRAADLLNLGRVAVRLVPSHEDFTMDVEALAYMLDEDTADGDVPFCVIGQAGSINVSAIDPLAEIAAVCEERDLWFHVDGACGAFGAMVPEFADDYEGMERADSVTLDPHKLLSIPYECGAVLVRDPDDMAAAFSMDAGYLRGSVAELPDELDFYEYGPQMSRGFRALKLWMTIKHYGVEGYRQLIRKNVGCAAHLHDLVESHENFVTVQEPNLYIYSFQYVPSDLAVALDQDDSGNERIETYLDELNQAIVDEVVASGLAFLTTTVIHGRRTLRTSICSHRTTEADMERVFDALAETGERIDGEWRKEAALPV